MVARSLRWDVEVPHNQSLRNRIPSTHHTYPLMRIAAILLTLCLGTTPFVTAESRPNVIIFVADDMAWDDCGAYGHPHIRTPNMDRLVAEGMRFDRAYLTCSSCSPSRCSMLTGRYPHATGAGELHLPLPKDQVLLTTPLREAGYYTASVGKWHLGKSAESQMDLVKQGGGPGGEAHWVTVLQERPKDKPFFFWFAATDPHRGYKPGAVDPPHTSDDVIVPPIFPDTMDVRRDLALYYDEVSRFDEFIGKVRTELEEQEILDETLLLVISDNGRPFPRCKTTVYEDGVRTPFIVRYPKLAKAGSTTSSVVSTVDIAPTVLDLTGLEPLDSFQGRSFLPVLSDPDQSTREFAFSEHNWHDYMAFERGVTDGRYRLIRDWLTATPCTPPADAVRSPTYSEMKRLRKEEKLTELQSSVFETPRPTLALYDIEADPHCENNLVTETAHQQHLQRLLEALNRWQKETRDQFRGVQRLTPDGFDRETGNRLPGVSAPHPSL